MDNFEYPESEIPRINAWTDWEIPVSVDFSLIEAAKEKMKLHDLVIVEGILVFADKDLAQLFDNRIFVKIDNEEFFKRKKKDGRWNEPRLVHSCFPR